MTKGYLYITLIILFLVTVNSWAQDKQQRNEEALEAADENTPLPPQESETKNTSGDEASNTERNPPVDTENKETTGLQNPGTKKKPTQESSHKSSVDNLNLILIIVLLAIVLTFFICAVWLLKQVKALSQESKKVMTMLSQIQTKDSSGLAANPRPSENDSQFKADLNDKLEQIARYMQIVSKSSTEAAAGSKETSAFTKQLSETIVSKEQELGILRDGYQRSMIGPVINGFLNLRDNLNTLLSTELEDELRKQLENLNESVGISLSEVGVNELLLEIGTDPLSVESKHWRSLEATRPTSEKRLDGTVAAIIKPGYTSISPQGAEIVIRKAEVVRYKYEN
ncbi:hypothetical protein N9C66_08780 [Akkermansiaceae bacterium]|nr:hypothetical protein [Akkermansiaceae bacterium]